MLVLFLGLGGWAFWIEPASISVKNYEIALPVWPAGCEGLRVAVLSDLHVGSPFNGLDKLDRVVALTNGARPDAILMTGDYVITGVKGGTFVAPESFAPRLGRLRAPMGVYAVLGNHDFWFDGGRVARALEASGIAMLEDRAIRLTRGGCTIRIAGLSDFWMSNHDVQAALHDVPAGAPVVVFTHNPDVFPLLPDRVSLTIAGHTHGGQVWFPIIGRPMVPSEYRQRFAAGHIVERGRHLFVSTGIGTSALPVRFMVPPEISVLEIR
jgi:predicted MPP superfamily phosphohydrolase